MSHLVELNFQLVADETESSVVTRTPPSPLSSNSSDSTVLLEPTRKRKCSSDVMDHDEARKVSFKSFFLSLLSDFVNEKVSYRREFFFLNLNTLDMSKLYHVLAVG